MYQDGNLFKGLLWGVMISFVLWVSVFSAFYHESIMFAFQSIIESLSPLIYV